MISKVWKKRVVALGAASGVCIFAILVCLLMYQFFVDMAFIVIAAVLCVVTSLCLVGVFLYIYSETSYFKAFEANLQEYAFVRYDKKRKRAYLSVDVSALTGYETAQPVIGEKEYKEFIAQIKSKPCSLQEGIYTSVSGDKWFQINSYSTEKYDCTAFKDVSKYVDSKNLIESLKFYDSSTGMLNRDAFIAKLRTSSETNQAKSTLGIIRFVLTGMEKVTSFSGSSMAESMIASSARYVKMYANPHNTFVGRTGNNEFSVIVTDTYDEGCAKTAGKIYNGLLGVIEAFPEAGRNVRVFCGYSCFHGNDNNINSMMSAADFAVFEAESKNSQEPVCFNSETYLTRAHEFKKLQVFNKVVMERRLDYHFQPVVNAKTGSIYGYEALIRPHEIDGIKLMPSELLSIAEQQDMLYEIEYITFFTTMKLLSENQDFFKNRRMFINCIPSTILSESDFALLADKYGTLFDKIVVEITEGSPVFESAIEKLNERVKSRKGQIALDDYGSGYSNDSTLLTVKPDYIKIDQSIMHGIDKDPQKQHLVANMINFASQHGFMSLAEGIETFDELETAISLGIDLVQGYVTCKPAAVLMLDIPEDVKKAIVEYNLKYTGHVNKTYEVTDSEPVDLVSLAVSGYNEIVIKSQTAVLKSNPEIEIEMKITVEAMEIESKVKLCGVNLANSAAPVITIAKGGFTNIELVGENTLSKNGIRVPSSSKLYISGSGNLTINCTANDSVAIGGGCIQDYGVIETDCEGRITVISKNENAVGIGGGTASAGSKINIISGHISMILKGKDVVGIGSFIGESDIRINPSEIEITIGGQNVVGIGSKSGLVRINSTGNINANISGDTCCCVGALDRSSGEIKINGGKNTIVVKGKNICGIGAINGNAEITLNAGTADILCEGDNATCVGDAYGSGYVRLRGTNVKAIARASAENPIGVKNGKVYVLGGSIETSDIAPLECYTDDDVPLVQRKVDGRKAFKVTVDSGKSVYSYWAAPVGEEYMYVYLPENIAVPK